MALYLANSGLTLLAKDGVLDQKVLMRWFKEAKRIKATGGTYYTKLLDSGLTLIFRTVVQNDDVEIAGVDMHLSGRCVWSAKPLTQVGKGEVLSITLLMTNVSERSAFIATLVHAATLDHIDEDSLLSLARFALSPKPVSYTAERRMSSTEERSRLEDKKLLPFNYIMARDESLTEEQRNAFLKSETMMLLCGPVLGVEKREHGFENTSCMVATISTEMGHLDLVFSEEQLKKPLVKGSYVVASCQISADVLAD